jgi:hypothetical protein
MPAPLLSVSRPGVVDRRPAVAGPGSAPSASRPPRVVADPRGLPSGRPRAGTRPALRLTRRGRLLLLALLVIALGVAFSLGRVSSAASPAGPPGSRPAVVVRPGDTLWSIALRVAPRRDPRVVVEQLAGLNRLAGAKVLPGQRLLLP